jgi:hypothetical protein
MLVSILSLNWSVSTTTQRVHVVIHNPIEAKKYFKWKSLLSHIQNEVKSIKNNSNIITQLIQSDYIGYKVNAHILTQWALQGFQMEVHAIQTLNGWFIPWLPDGKPSLFKGTLQEVWELQNIYEEMGVHLKIDLGDLY